MTINPRRRVPALFALALLCFGFNTAQAGMLGFTIGAEAHADSIGSVCCGSASAIVGPGVEFPEGFLPDYNESAYADISDLQILYGITRGTNYSAADFNGFRFFDSLGLLAPITGVSIHSTSGLSGFDAGRVSFDEDSVYLNMEGLNPDGGHSVLLDVQFGNVAEVPEPASILMLGAGLAGIGLLRRRFAAKR